MVFSSRMQRSQLLGNRIDDKVTFSLLHALDCWWAVTLTLTTGAAHRISSCKRAPRRPGNGVVKKIPLLLESGRFEGHRIDI